MKYIMLTKIINYKYRIMGFKYAIYNTILSVLDLINNYQIQMMALL